MQGETAPINPFEDNSTYRFRRFVREPYLNDFPPLILNTKQSNKRTSTTKLYNIGLFMMFSLSKLMKFLYTIKLK